MNSSGPLFIAQEALCYYEISTIYNSCPRYLFYALLIASCVTRWTGWLADVFLGAAATYAGTAAIEAFILLASEQKRPKPAPVTIPFISDNTTLWNDFPQLITETNQVMIQPGSLELDGDAVLAIVVTGYLVFLPLQCWSRILTHQRARNFLFYLWNLLMLTGSICALVYAANKSKTPTQYMFCYPGLPPYDTTSNDGWQSSWRTSTWNESVWETFSNITRWSLIGDICYNPCFNSSQTLRQSTSLQSWVASKDSELSHPARFWDKLIYSRRYIYSLIILCLVLNLVHLTFKFLPYRSRIPSAEIIVIWKERKNIWNGFKGELKTARSKAKEELVHKEADLSNGNSPLSSHIRPLFSMTFLRAFMRVLADFLILFGLVFSMIISPFTIIAFVAWAEWTIYNDGPAQESPRQVGQWSYLVSIGLLLISAAILTLKYRLATMSELDEEIEKLRDDLEKLEQRKEKRLRSATAPLMTLENTTEDG
ncbi:uncharacterized protein N7496_005530 [Penicillium cataractarum]|uniref:Uncharacterized protein n=1 Tax=Penicillium cataractarum TaxID=2100454 RepID=A0A9W9SGD1_9EURO|nr:uncharacterized protein N7496_005530 [Penicillium cataractarum]KAJ5378121.1 hypothetical protein N7496_005530 [Penicillium cataractarum]